MSEPTCKRCRDTGIVGEEKETVCGLPVVILCTCERGERHKDGRSLVEAFEKLWKGAPGT